MTGISYHALLARRQPTEAIVARDETQPSLQQI